MRPLVLTAALVLAGCATSGGPALLRVDPPPAGNAVADGSELRIAQAIRDTAADERLACRPGSGGAVLLTCSPADIGSRAAQATIHLERAGTGYRVRIEEAAVPGFHADPAALCSLQKRLQRAIDAALGVPSTHPDPQGRCGPESTAQ
jgi:hypothetical protein